MNRYTYQPVICFGFSLLSLRRFNHANDPNVNQATNMRWRVQS
jgi:hypothetical protein